MKNIQKRRLSQQAGSALLEAIIALGAVVLAIAGIAIVVASSASNAGFIQNQNQANKYAQEGMEYLRSVQDRSYANFLSTYMLGTEYCLGDGFDRGIEEDCANYRLDDGRYIRKVIVSPADAARCGNVDPENTRLVTITVAWQSGKCDVNTDSFCHNSELVSCFSQPPLFGIAPDEDPTPTPTPTPPPVSTPTPTPTRTPTPTPTPTPPASCMPDGSFGCRTDSVCCSNNCNFLFCASSSPNPTVTPTPTPTRTPTPTPTPPASCMPVGSFGCTSNANCCSNNCNFFVCRN